MSPVSPAGFHTVGSQTRPAENAGRVRRAIRLTRTSRSCAAGPQTRTRPWTAGVFLIGRPGAGKTWSWRSSASCRARTLGAVRHSLRHEVDQARHCTGRACPWTPLLSPWPVTRPVRYGALRMAAATTTNMPVEYLTGRQRAWWP